MRIDKLHGLLLAAVASKNGIHSHLKRGNFVTQHCLFKWALENKLLNKNC